MATASARSGRVALRKFATEWLALRSDLEDTTRELYDWLLKKHILPTFGDVSIAGMFRERIGLFDAGSDIGSWGHIYDDEIEPWPEEEEPLNHE